MNLKGSVTFYGFMLGLVILILALALAPSVTEFSSNAQNETYQGNPALNCSNTSISNFDKAACYAVDLNPFYFIGSLIFIAGAIISARFVF